MIEQFISNISISTHSLTRRLTGRHKKTGSRDKNFNSQPHKEADGITSGISRIDRSISTHSLTRRLTFLTLTYDDDHIISTHSLTRRLTRSSVKPLIGQKISTHSLTRRLTSLR